MVRPARAVRPSLLACLRRARLHAAASEPNPCDARRDDDAYPRDYWGRVGRATGGF